jgi:hypothetical protein
VGERSFQLTQFWAFLLYTHSMQKWVRTRPKGGALALWLTHAPVVFLPPLHHGAQFQHCSLVAPGLAVLCMAPASFSDGDRAVKRLCVGALTHLTAGGVVVAC